MCKKVDGFVRFPHPQLSLPGEAANISKVRTVEMREVSFALAQLVSSPLLINASKKKKKPTVKILFSITMLHSQCYLYNLNYILTNLPEKSNFLNCSFQEQHFYLFFLNKRLLHH